MSQPPAHHPAFSAPVSPVCPRHQDRVSYVTCQRCGRPVCPECQVAAPVGVQCVDCVRAAAAGTRQARTVAGAVVRGGRPVITFGFIAACVVVYLGQLSPFGRTLETQLAFFGPLAHSEPWRYFTSAFLHATGGLSLHLAFNMYAMWLLGPPLEFALGRARYVVLLVLGAFGSSVGYQFLVGMNSFSSVVGASGVVFALFGALLVGAKRLGLSVRGLITVVALNLVIGFMIPNIAWQGHLGGLVTGMIAGAVLVYAPAKNRALFQTLGLGILGVVLVAVAALPGLALG